MSLSLFFFVDRENANLADVAFGGNNERGAKSTSVMKKDKGSKKEDIDSFLTYLILCCYLAF